MWLSFSSWWVLVKNFAVDGLHLTGREIGFQESIREIPGFLSFLAIYVVFYIREQTLALVSLVVLGAGLAATGYLPTALGLYLTTFVMSVGFHYYETMNQSLALQWLPKETAAHQMGKLISLGAIAQLIAYGTIYTGWKFFGLSFEMAFLIPGLFTIAVALLAWKLFPSFKQPTAQKKQIILRKRYWLFYALTFMSGARRQIFTVFASFMMVEKFGYEVHSIALLFLINCIINILFAAKVGSLIGKMGEKKALTIEYIGLFGVFVTYAFVTSADLAAFLYIIDHAFFAFAIAIKTYFQKIADPTEIAPTTGVAFTINHIAAVGLPAFFGIIWLYSPTAVFLTGAVMAAVSLGLARLVPDDPRDGNETIFSKPSKSYSAAE
ncbi:MAG: MFS transporter [Hyphomicrobiales bacterium]|nr:MAG: MFS transporter [Hyphomicrobiales bacterium]